MSQGYKHTSNEDVGQALKSLYEQDLDGEGMILFNLKAIQIVRPDIINTKSEFDGTFENNCHRTAQFQNP